MCGVGGMCIDLRGAHISTRGFTSVPDLAWIQRDSMDPVWAQIITFYCGHEASQALVEIVLSVKTEEDELC